MSRTFLSTFSSSSSASSARRPAVAAPTGVGSETSSNTSMLLAVRLERCSIPASLSITT